MIKAIQILTLIITYNYSYDLKDKIQRSLFNLTVWKRVLIYIIQYSAYFNYFFCFRGKLRFSNVRQTSYRPSRGNFGTALLQGKLSEFGVIWRNINCFNYLPTETSAKNINLPRKRAVLQLSRKGLFRAFYNHFVMQ